MIAAIALLATGIALGSIVIGLFAGRRIGILEHEVAHERAAREVAVKTGIALENEVARHRVEIQIWREFVGILRDKLRGVNVEHQPWIGLELRPLHTDMISTLEMVTKGPVPTLAEVIETVEGEGPDGDERSIL